MHIARLQQRPVPMPHRRLQTPPIVKHLRMIRRKGMPQDVLTPCLKTRCRAQSAPPPVPIWRTDENRLPLCPLRIITPQPCQHGARQRHLPTAARLALPQANPHLPLLPIHIAPGQTPHLIRTNPAVEHHRHARRTGENSSLSAVRSRRRTSSIRRGTISRSVTRGTSTSRTGLCAHQPFFHATVNTPERIARA